MQHSPNDMGTPKDLALHRIDVAKEDLETAECNYSENHLYNLSSRQNWIVAHIQLSNGIINRINPALTVSIEMTMSKY